MSFNFLKNHPFPVEAHFDHSIVLTFAVEKSQVAPLLPPCLEPDTFQDKWAFLAVAMVQAKHLRPKGFPKMLGNDFFLIGYRIFVRYHTSKGKRLRGLYILKSETDKRKMTLLGNIFTHYNYSLTDISQKIEGDQIGISSKKSGFSVALEEDEEAQLPPNSPFSTWKEARRYAGPLPFTFTYYPDSKQVLMIQGVRQNWTPTPVRVLDYQLHFLNQPEFEGAQLANAFIIKDIPYHWKKGQLDHWKP